MSFERQHPEGEPPKGDEPLPNSAVEEFFSKMNREVRRPKPSDEAVAAALQAIQRLAGEFQAEQDLGAGAVMSSTEGQEVFQRPGDPCPKCGGVNANGNHFCGFCGAALDEAKVSTPPPPPAIAGSSSHRVYHHHHYHHHYFSSAQPSSRGDTRGQENPLVPETFDGPIDVPSVERGNREPILRKLIEDWVFHWNRKSARDVASLYSSDALVLRPDTPSLRGRSAIERQLESGFESGSGEVQLEITDLRALGPIAWVTGISLLPDSLSKRPERTGKFLMLARYETDEWKIVVDVWCLNREPAAAPADTPAVVKDTVPATKTSEHARYRYTW
ncbi:MAG: DUF4440 domain-containing protein [Acidobacteria bacterium]|nr:DUF4440 domain-containing protein [Acidobacteriota bacterium]